MISMLWLHSSGKVIDMGVEFGMKARFSSCMYCKTRTVGCHSTCQKYLAEKAEHDRKSEEYKKMKSEEVIVDGFKVRAVQETKKRCGRR